MPMLDRSHLQFGPLFRLKHLPSALGRIIHDVGEHNAFNLVEACRHFVWSAIPFTLHA
jgi:hypothetical protein